MLRYGLAAVLAVLSAASAAQSFETACDGLSAPAADVRVLFAPAAAQVDESKASREIELDTKKAGAFRHLGVTRATLLRDVDVRVDGYTDPQTGRACAWPKVKLRLRVQPLLIELARELGADPCMRTPMYSSTKCSMSRSTTLRCCAHRYSWRARCARISTGVCSWAMPRP